MVLSHPSGTLVSEKKVKSFCLSPSLQQQHQGTTITSATVSVPEVIWFPDVAATKTWVLWFMNPLGHWVPKWSTVLSSWIPWATGCPSDPLGFSVESLGPLGAQVIHLVFLLNPLGPWGPKWSTCFFSSSESVGPFWGPSDPLVFSRSSCQVLFGSVLSYFGHTVVTVSHCYCSLEELLTRVSLLFPAKKGQKKGQDCAFVCFYLCGFACVCVCVCVCVCSSLAVST